MQTPSDRESRVYHMQPHKTQEQQAVATPADGVFSQLCTGAQQQHGLDHSPPPGMIPHGTPMPPAPSQLEQQDPGSRPTSSPAPLSQHHPAPSTGAPASPISPSSAELLQQLHELQQQLAAMGPSGPSTGHAAVAHGSSTIQLHAGQVSTGVSSCNAPVAGTIAHIQALLQPAQPGQGGPVAGSSPRAGEAGVQAGSRSDSSMQQALGPNPWPAPPGAQPQSAAFGSTTEHLSAHSSISGAPRMQAVSSHSADNHIMPAAADARTAGTHGSSGSCLRPTDPIVPFPGPYSSQHTPRPVSGPHVGYPADPNYITPSVPVELLPCRGPPRPAAQLSSTAPPVPQGPAAFPAAAFGRSVPGAEALLRKMLYPSWMQPGAGGSSFSTGHSMHAAPTSALLEARPPGSPTRQDLVQAVMAWQDAAAQAAANSTPSPPAAAHPVSTGMQSTGAAAGSSYGNLPVLNMPQQHQEPSSMAQVSAQQPVAATQYAPHGLANFGTAATGLASMGPVGYPAQAVQQQQQQQAMHGMQQHAAAPGTWNSTNPPLIAPAQGPHESVVAAQQQLEHLLRLQQLQMMQMQVQLQAMAGAAPAGHLPFAAGLQPGPLSGHMWGTVPLAMPPGMLHPTWQLQQQLAAPSTESAAAHAAQHTQQAGQAAAGPPSVPAQEPVAGDTSGMPVCNSPFQCVQQQQQQLQAGFSESAHRCSTGEGGAATAPAGDRTDPSTAAAAGNSLLAASDSWLGKWMPLSPRTSPGRKAVSRHPAGTTSATPSRQLSETDTIQMACAGATRTPTSSVAVPSVILQCALYPVTAPLAAAYGASSLALHIVLTVGRTAAAASAWSVHSTALMCVTISQYQLLVLLCCLAATAAAAQAAGAAAAAAVDSGRMVLQLANRESRLFGRAATLVAFSDVRKLCRLLATHPLLLLNGVEGTSPGQGAVRAAQAGAQPPQVLQELSAAAAGSTAAPQHTEAGAASNSGSRSLSRAPSSLLGGLLGVSAAGQQPEGSVSCKGSLHLTPGASLGGSRRSIGYWGVGFTQQETTSAASADAAVLAAVGPTVGPTPAAGSRRTSQDLIVQSSSNLHAGGVRARLGAQPVVRGVSAKSLIVYDSLAVVSGLWAGLWFRLWLLLALQGPVACCRIWLHALKTGCSMSVATAGAAAGTALQVTWGLSHLSLAVLGTARAADAAQAAASPPDTPAPAASPSAAFPPHATLPLLLCMFQWAWMQLCIPFCSLGCYLTAAAVSATGPRGKALVQLLGGCWMRASSALAAAAGSFLHSECMMRQSHKVHGRAGLWSKGAMQQAGMHVLYLAGQLAAWAVSCVFAVMEAGAAYAAEWLLRDLPPVGRAAVYGSAGMIKGLVVEASRQSGLLAGQLFEAWKAHESQ